MDEGLIGRSLGPYRLTGVLTTDNLGTLYEAVEEASQAPRTVRIVAPAILEVPGAAGRLDNAIRLAAQMPELPHVARLLDSGAADGYRYLVFERFGGQTLSQVLGRVQSIAPRHVATALDQAAVGLDALHGVGALHGDVRPENIVVSPEGQVLLRNVGLARVLQDPDAPAAVTPYTSPEVLAGGADAYGPASDVYALGQTVYALLAGRPAFEGDGETLRQQALTGQAPPLAGPAEAVDSVVRRALDPAPDSRWPTAGVFAAAFQAALAPGAVPVAAAAAGTAAATTAATTAAPSPASMPETAAPPTSAARSAEELPASGEPPVGEESHATGEPPVAREASVAGEPPVAMAPPSSARPRGGPMWLWILLALALIVALAWWVGRQESAGGQMASPTTTTTPIAVASGTPAGAAGQTTAAAATVEVGRTPTDGSGRATAAAGAATRTQAAAAATAATAAATESAVRSPGTAVAGTESPAGVPEVTLEADRLVASAANPCVTLSWDVAGAEEVYVSSQGQPELEVDATGALEDCLQAGQVKTYTLRAVSADGETVTKQVTVAWP